MWQFFKFYKLIFGVFYFRISRMAYAKAYLCFHDISGDFPDSSFIVNEEATSLALYHRCGSSEVSPTNKEKMLNTTVVIKRPDVVRYWCDKE